MSKPHHISSLISSEQSLRQLCTIVESSAIVITWYLNVYETGADDLCEFIVTLHLLSKHSIHALRVHHRVLVPSSF